VDDQTIQAVVDEIAPLLVGRTFGKIFQTSRLSIAVDFRLRDDRYLFINVEPSEPRLHLISRRVRDLEKQSTQLSPFAQVLRKHLSGALVQSIKKDESDRVVQFIFETEDELGRRGSRTLVAQLTGRAANLLLLDERGLVIDSLREPRGEGQQVGEHYQPPPISSSKPHVKKFEVGSGSISEAADRYYKQKEAEREFAARAAMVRSRLNKEIAQRSKLQRRLQEDLEAHGDADEHKRIGDLLLANLSTATRRGNLVALTDFYAEGAPQIEIEVDEQTTLQREAARRFARYSKAKRAAEEITGRLHTISEEISGLNAQQAELERAIELRDEEAIARLAGKKEESKESEKRGRSKRDEKVPGVRRYRSSDGYEILVGRAARDNDHLTFRVARPHDWWFHAADYPGSHVIVRNPARKEIPHRTLIEAAQLAAFFSQARSDSKVDVRYTQRKFLAKPKGAAYGLVRMSSFRTLTVEPRMSVERIIK